MFRRFRRPFFLLTALGYGLLGGGPSLWALSLPTAAPGEACALMGGTCNMRDHKPGQPCCCLMRLALLKKFPELAKEPIYAKLLWQQRAAQAGCRIQAPPCGAQRSQLPLAPLQGHTLADTVKLPLLGVQRVQPSPAPRGSSYVPEPPTPIPD